jgi:hypothetical protein
VSFNIWLACASLVLLYLGWRGLRFVCRMLIMLDIPCGRYAPWVFGCALGRWPRRVRKDKEKPQ